MCDTYFDSWDSHVIQVTNKNIDEFEFVFDFREVERIHDSETDEYEQEDVTRVATGSGGYSCGRLHWIKKGTQKSLRSLIYKKKSEVEMLERSLKYAREDLVKTKNKRKIILDLCGGTGSWSKPYKEAGYDVRLVTLPNNDVRTYEPPENVYGILAAPPCTEFSLLNCIAENRTRNFEEGMEIVNACLKIIEKCKPIFWALENPIGHLKKYLGNSAFTFQPWEFGDAWTKLTCLWGKFNKPIKQYANWQDVEKLNLYIRPNRGKPNFAFLHKSAITNIPQLSGYNPKTDAEFRAITPPGFAKAFFLANQCEEENETTL
jgi:hypothetical protein